MVANLMYLISDQGKFKISLDKLGLADELLKIATTKLSQSYDHNDSNDYLARQLKEPISFSRSNIQGYSIDNKFGDLKTIDINPILPNGNYLSKRPFEQLTNIASNRYLALMPEKNSNYSMTALLSSYSPSCTSCTYK